MQTLGSPNRMQYDLLFEWQYYHWYGELKIHETHDKRQKQIRQQNITFHSVQVPSMVSFISEKYRRDLSSFHIVAERIPEVFVPLVLIPLVSIPVVRPRDAPQGGGGGAYSNFNLQKRGFIWEGVGLIQKSGKYVAKGPKQCLEILQNGLDRRAIKLNYIKLDNSCGHVKRTFNQWLFFFDWIWQEIGGGRGLIREGAY